MNINDDEIKALESRLRQNGWTEKASPEKLSTKKRRPVKSPKGFGPLQGSIKEAAQSMAKAFNGYSWPMYLEVADEFGLSFDDAVRAVGEAKRLAGDDA